MSLRTDATEADYTKAKQDGTLKPLVDEEALREWKYWKLIKNRFPHDRHHVESDLLVLKEQGLTFFTLTADQYAELRLIYTEIYKEYDYMKINFPSVISVPEFVHVHLLKLKEEYK